MFEKLITKKLPCTTPSHLVATLVGFTTPTRVYVSGYLSRRHFSKAVLMTKHSPKAARFFVRANHPGYFQAIRPKQIARAAARFRAQSAMDLRSACYNYIALHSKCNSTS